MNNEHQNDPTSKTGLIDRRFFLKATSATVAVVAAATVLPVAAAEHQIPESETKLPATGDTSKTNKHWHAGWMAF